MAINLEKQVYYDFHYNQGGSLITLLRHLGAPISQDTARASPLLSYRYQVAILAHTKSEGRYGGCGKRTAVKQSQETGSYLEAHRIMCLQWNCPRCAPLLKEMWLEILAEYHFGAIYLIPKGYKPGSALNRIKQRVRRAGGEFEWLLLESNELKILFVDSRSLPKVTEWLRDEPFFELEALGPTYAERTKWLEIGLEKMNERSDWNHKVRHSKGIASIRSSVDNVSNTRESNITSSTQRLEPPPPEVEEMVKGLEQYCIEYDRITYICHKVDSAAFLGYRWDSIDKTLEELVTELESEGYTTDWLTEDIVRLIPSRGGG